MEPTVEKKWAYLQRREWNSGPFGAIERLPGESFAVRAAASIDLTTACENETNNSN